MGSYLPHLRLSAAMVSRLTLLSLFALLPTIYSGGYYRYKPTKSVLETLVGDPRFSTLVTAVTTAFPDPGAVLDTVGLKAILLRHIVPKEVVNVGRDSFTVPEAGGGEVTVKPQVTSSSGTANVVIANIMAKDGIVHAIDALL